LHWSQLSSPKTPELFVVEVSTLVDRKSKRLGAGGGDPFVGRIGVKLFGSETTGHFVIPGCRSGVRTDAFLALVCLVIRRPTVRISFVLHNPFLSNTILSDSFTSQSCAMVVISQLQSNDILSSPSKVHPLGLFSHFS